MRYFEDPAVTHCIFGPAICKDSLCGPVPILLKLQSAVVVFTHLADEPMPLDVMHLTEPDADGNRLSRVPANHAESFMSDEDVETWRTVQIIEGSPTHHYTRVLR